MQTVFRALSDPTRRQILNHLSTGSMSAGELAERFPISRASLSHHFNILKAADLVRAERRGQSIVYSLNTTVIDEIVAMVADLFDSRCGRKPPRSKKETP